MVALGYNGNTPDMKGGMRSLGSVDFAPSHELVESEFVTGAGIVYAQKPYRTAAVGGPLTKGDSAHENP